MAWGLQVPDLCLLCGQAVETREHDCFSIAHTLHKCHLSPPVEFEAEIRRAKRPTPNGNVALLIKPAFEASMYFIWKERNVRLHRH
ncbi:unnamed protein product [Eruca vesicaria subsp. sativa]|uniref:Uncharacterized protein n=1 Tax=Eruca vesicaria subsp. sativa TaxID=29727 RepID=A0ABC8KPK1_ERUVS|nr:unnamed protein product [Eruca vesicaria subsp. sativa]